MAQWDRQHLGSAGTQVQCLARYSGLRIPCCHSFSLIQGSGSDLAWELQMPWGQSRKTKKNQGTDERQMRGRQRPFQRRSSALVNAKGKGNTAVLFFFLRVKSAAQGNSWTRGLI